ncbi:MAG TPA: M15 family metallopeptidase [Saprospiraceae bacterium]|nr:M15 family metallopeptidase [Saprospiraceae bacterium]
MSLSLYFYIIFISCRPEAKPHSPNPAIVHDVTSNQQIDYDTTKWTELTIKDGYVIDMKYATTDNFVKTAMYPCARMFLKPDVAKALGRVRDRVKKADCRLKLFDGYRPRPVQYQLWRKVPDPDYVTDPAKGSMHNRGLAIDLTLTDMYGTELDMGTPYDFFGPEAHQDYTKLSAMILSRRKLLTSAMEAEGFQSIRTEWWHFSYTKASYPLEDWQWPCRYE